MTQLFTEDIVSIPKKKFYMLLNGDVNHWLSRLPDECVDCTVSSPPYWGLRNYQVDGQIGLEVKFQDYVSRIVSVFHEVRRVTKKSGSLFLNLGDTYSTAKPEIRDNKQVSEIRHAPLVERDVGDITEKSLLMIPERIALGMIDDGWILRNKIVWAKPNHMPSSVDDRFTPSYEIVYFFTKEPQYQFFLDKVRIPQKFPEDVARRIFQDKQDGIVPFAKDSPSQKWRRGEISQMEYRKLLWESRGEKTDMQFSKEKRYDGKFSNGEINPESVGSPRAREMRKQDNVPSKNAGTYEGFNERWKQKYHQEHGQSPQSFTRKNHSGYFDKDGNPLYNPNVGKNPGDVWSINTQPLPEAHFASFPEELVKIPLTATCKDSTSVVLDSFLGSGTTMKVSRELGFSCIGIDLNPEYIQIAKRRTGFGQRTLANVVEWVEHSTSA